MAQAFSPRAWAAINHTINSTTKLDAIGAEIHTSVDATHLVSFMAYTNVGHFVLDGTNKADTVIFTKGDESDSAVQVTDNLPLFDIKSMKGTIIFRNVAFHLASANAVLISGADQTKKNNNIIFDSCLIFGEAANSTFLTWWGDANSKVQIYRSFINMGNGGGVSLTAGTVDLRNNVFNFAGLVTTTSTQLFRLDHNTIVRTQFDANGDHLKSDYKVIDNLFTHHSQQNALGIGGDTAYFPMLFSNFNESSPSVKRNVAYDAWRGFEPPPGARFTSDSTNKRIVTPVAGKDSAEAWDWYKAYPAVGFDFGLDKSPDPYNVFPGKTAFTGTTPDNKTLKIFFKPSSIPRRCLPQWGGAVLDSLMNDSLRLLWPGQQGLTLGDHVFFGLDSMNISPVTGPGGNPVLLAYTGSWNKPAQSEPVSKPGRFVNGFPAAVAFHPAYLCGTPRGLKIVPTTAIPPDRLVFGKVDSAGYTVINGYQSPPLRDSLRYLNTSYGFTTTAVISVAPGDSMVFGTSLVRPKDPASIPYRSDKVFWWVKDLDTLLAADQVQDSVYVSTVRDLPKLEAYLVERLSARKGKDLFPIRNGSVTVRTSGGFQIDIDSTAYKPDSNLFGKPSAGVGFGWAGRTDSDTVEIRFKKTAGMEAFRDSAGSISAFPYQDDSGGYARLRIGKTDSGKAFFMGVAYNVAANKSVDTVIDGVKINGFLSSSPGRIAVRQLDASVLGEDDSTFKDARFLGGFLIDTLHLNVTSANWEAFIPLIKGPGDISKMEVYGWNGHDWRTRLPIIVPSAGPLQVKSIGKNIIGLAAIERVLPANTYINIKFQPNEKNELVFSTSYKDTVNHDIVSFKVEIKSVDQNGLVDTVLSAAKPIGQSAVFPPLDGKIATYRFIYLKGDGTEYSRESAVTTKPAWNPASLFIAERTKLEDQWALIGFPANGNLSKVLLRQPLNRGDTVLDVRYLLRLKTVNGKARYDTIPDRDADTFKFNAGDALLLGSTRRYKVVADSSLTFQEAKEFTTAPAQDSGWKLIACPFPIYFLAGNVKSSESMGSFMLLDLDLLATPRTYIWRPEATLQPFKGYAYFFHKGETLTFNPFMAMAAATAKVSAGSGRAYEASVRGADRSSRALLTDAAGQRSIPFLPVPGGGLEMRLGGGEGFLRKNLAKLDALDETVEFRSPGAMKAAFALNPSGASPVFQQVRLIDVTVGKIYEGGDLLSLPLRKGPQTFRLLAGDRGFVEERTRAALAGAPREILLSQNFPNPVRRSTRILLDWPAAPGPDRTAVLEVFDTRGRAVQRLDLGRVAMGRQVLDLDAGGWNPGIYTYRLTVTTGSESMRMQKRMLVAK
jgi:hypothetical protein